MLYIYVYMNNSKCIHTYMYLYIIYNIYMFTYIHTHIMCAFERERERVCCVYLCIYYIYAGMQRDCCSKFNQMHVCNDDAHDNFVFKILFLRYYVFKTYINNLTISL
jgi:hypothetical protein